MAAALKLRFIHLFPYDEIHTRFYRRILGGEVVSLDPSRLSHQADPLDPKIREQIDPHDGPDTAWFTTVPWPDLIRALKGRRILLRHGAGVGAKPSTWGQMINNCFDAVFETSAHFMQEDRALGADPRKLKAIGYHILLEMPARPVRPNAILISQTKFTPWNPETTTLGIMRRIAPPYHGYVTLHPLYDENVRQIFRRECEKNRNLTFLETQDELLEAYRFCEMGMGQHGSAAAVFWSLQKPWIFVRGRLIGVRPLRGWNPLRGFGWERLARQVRNPLFRDILRESVKISSPRRYSEKCLQEARPSPSARKLFFEWNGDERATVEKVREALYGMGVAGV